MSFFSNIVKNFKDFYSEINGATLTGAIDVIVVEQEDGTFKSSPFHVRFGKLGVMKAKEKIVDLEVNGEPVELQMKLDDSGVAFFVEDVDNSDDSWMDDIATSPIVNQTDSEVEVSLKNTEKEAEDLFIFDEMPSNTSGKEKIKSASLQILESPTDHKKKKRKRRFSLNGSRRSLTAAFLKIDSLTDSTEDMFGMDECYDSEQECDDNESIFESSASQSPLTNDLESLLIEPGHEATKLESNDFEVDSVYSEPASFQWKQESKVCFMAGSSVLGNEEPNIWKWGQLPITQHSIFTQDQTEIKQCKLEQMNQEKEHCSDNYKEGPVDDIVDNSDLQSSYPKPIKTEPGFPLDVPDKLKNDCSNQKEDKCEFLQVSTKTVKEAHRMKRIDSGCEIDPESQSCETDIPCIISDLLPDLAASLCGGLTSDVITPEQFEADLLTFPQFVQQVMGGAGGAVTDHNLVIRVQEKYLSWDTAAPILLSVILFRQPLPCDVVREITKDCLDVNINMSAEDNINIDNEEKPTSWREWFSNTPKEDGIDGKKNESGSVEVNPKPHKTRLNTESSITPSEDLDCLENKRQFVKSLRLSSEQFAELKLKPGCNEVQFSVTTAFQGTSRCSCFIYLWHHTDKVVISDIDGTITKSDMLGHILPAIGRDWAQSGVAELFTNIRKNGYHIMYLSARAIGQASITKDYLQSVKQGNMCLPDGPVFLNPDSLIHAFKREVIDRNPEEFKISCLRDIQSLFGEKNPFFAGYGNRPNDAFAYRSVGIPVTRIFTINPAGEVKHELTKNFQTTYPEQKGVVDLVFPSVGDRGFDPDFDIQQFSSFGFWRSSFPELEPLELH